MPTFDNCNWAVCSDIDGKTQDDGQTKRTVTAWFKYPTLAEGFINNVLPAENKERFYILHRDEIEKEA